MRSAEIRTMFREFYEGHGHQSVPSASLVPSSYDPSVLLTTAGMQPFKPYFRGDSQPPASRLTSVQKCFRTPDIDEVGNTARHLTFFEMLGNFSFGDYFKPGAIEMAWELVTGRLGIDADRLWVTVHEGDASLGLGIDQEAVDLWLGVGVPRERIVALGADNFWKAGPTGPCGPCSEIYFDRGVQHQIDCPDPAACAPGCECDRYLEFYNLVFMQYDRDEGGALHDLPNQNIDTGMGLERVSSLLQGNVSVFEIDSFRTIIEHAEQLSGRTYGSDSVATKALRVLCDHGRGMSFLASDGVMPSNEGRGYVLRRIIRRAIQQADRLGMYGGPGAGSGSGGVSGAGDSGVLVGIHARVVEEWGPAYPELVEQQAVVAELLAAEEERFLRTLGAGSELLAGVLDRVEASGGSVVPGDDAFALHDTHGFPWELTTELAAERGMTVDRARFDELMHEQRERARAAAGGGSVPVDEAAVVVRSAPATTFTGYTSLAEQTTVTAAQTLEPAGSGRVLLKLDRSPLYAEGGGQVSDSGWVTGERGRARVEAVLRFEDDQVIVASVDGSIDVGDSVTVEVDAPLRAATESNHTATHLLHLALRERLGTHVRQAGSLVDPSRLRFDFTHTSSLEQDDLDAISAAVNDLVAAAADVAWVELPIDEAREAGAMMLFGEKYGDVVRMVTVGDGESRELCGGTHVSNTAAIRHVELVGESSVGANTRRIEALTGEGALRWLRERATAATAAAEAANADIVDLPSRVADLVAANRRLERELSSARSGSLVDDAVATAQQVGDVSVVTFRADSLDGDELLELADRVGSKLAPAAVLLGAAHPDGKVSVVAKVADVAVEQGMHAGNVVREVAALVGGGGGGRPTMARAGGRDASKLDAALSAGREMLVGAGS